MPSGLGSSKRASDPPSWIHPSSSPDQVAPFVDSNVFLRHLLDDHPVHSPASLALMEALERKERVAWTTDVVVAELVWVMSARDTYNLPRERIRELLLP